MIVWMAVAMAQQQPVYPGQEGFVPPAVDASGPRVVRDGRWAFHTDTGAVDAGRYAGLVTSYVAAPVRWTSEEGESQDLVSGAVGAVGVAGLSNDWISVGIAAPVWVVSGSFWEGTKGVLGDPSLDAAVELAQTDAFGVGVIGRLQGSLGADRRMMGAPGWSGELGLAGHLTPGPLRIAADVSGLLGPSAALVGFSQGDAIRADGAAGVALWKVVVAAEVATRFELGSGDQPAAAEGLLGVHAPLESGWGLHLGFGRGLSSAVGSPVWRGVAGVRFRG